MTPKTPDTVLADSCRWVAYSAWCAAYRDAHHDRPADPDVQQRVEILVHDTDFIDLALKGSQWRNINRLLAAFTAAGEAGTANVAAHYDHAYYLSEGESPSESPELWKGKLSLPERLDHADPPDSGP
ncbi:hypothetical protein ACWCPT_29400 [Streptomyces sp. NPDC002308]